MIRSIEGTYRNGRVELDEIPADVTQARVIITFLPAEEERPMSPGFTRAEAANLRGRLAAWEEDWNAPGMEAYDEL